MIEIQKLITPHVAGDPSVAAQLTALFEQVAKESGCHVFDHPEEHCFNIVFAGHQVTVSISERR